MSQQSRYWFMAIGTLLALVGCSSPPPPASAQGYTLEVRGGTTNLDSSFFNPSVTSLNEQKIANSLKAQALEQFGVQIRPQATQAIGVNLFVQVLKDGVAPTAPTNITLESYEGGSNLEAGQAWNVLFPIEADPSNNYTVTTTTNGVKLQQKVNIPTQPSSNLLPIPQNLRIDASNSLAVASWSAVQGAKSYIVLIYDRQERKVVWAGDVNTNQVQKSGLNLTTETFRYELNVFALSWDITQPLNQPHPQPLPNQFNASVAARYVSPTFPNLESITPSNITIGAQLGGKATAEVVIKTRYGGPMTYQLAFPTGSPFRIVAPTSSTGILLAEQELRIQVEGTCPNNETDLSANLTLTTNLGTEAVRTIPVALECSRPIQASLALNRPGQINSYDVAWSPDRSKIAVSSSGKIIIWDAATGSALQSIPLRRAPSFSQSHESINWSPDSTRIAHATDGGVQVFSSSTGAEVLAMAVSGQPYWSPNGELLAIAGVQNLGVYNANSGALLWQVSTSIYSNVVRWTVDSQRILALRYQYNPSNNSSETTIQSYRASDGNTVGVPILIDVYSSLFDLTSNNQQVVGLRNGTLTVFNLSDGSVARTITSISNSLLDLRLDSTSTQLAVLLGGNANTTIQNINFATGAILFSRSFSTPESSSALVPQVSWNPNGTALAFSDNLGLTPILNSSNGTILRTLGFFTGSVDALAFRPDNPLLLVGASTSLRSSTRGILRTLNLSNSQSSVLDTAVAIGKLSWPTSSTTVVGISRDSLCCLLRTWSTATATQTSSRTLTNNTSSTSWSNSGSHLMYLGETGRWNIVNALSNDIVSVDSTGVVDQPQRSWSAWNSDDTRVATLNYNELRIFDTTTGRSVGNTTLSNNFSPESGFQWAVGDKIVIPTNSFLAVYDAGTGLERLKQTVDPIEYNVGSYGLQIYGVSPDGRKLAWATRNGVDIRSLITGNLITTIGRPPIDPSTPDAVIQLAWNSNGEYLAVGSRYGNLEVYRITPVN